jgi:hypothetical protein
MVLVLRFGFGRTYRTEDFTSGQAVGKGDFGSVTAVVIDSSMLMPI